MRHQAAHVERSPRARVRLAYCLGVLGRAKRGGLESPGPAAVSQARRMSMNPTAAVEVADWMVIISLLLVDERRAIDKYIDYFGGTPHDESDTVSRAA